MKKITLLFALLFAYAVYPQTWTYLSSLPTSIQINSITAVDANVLFTACDGGKVYRSLNGGTTWESKSTGLGSANMYGISAVDSLTCWVGNGNGAIFKTTNGGTSWTQQIAVSGSFINGVHMFDANHGFYVGDPTGNNVPYQYRYTVDGGANWIISPGAPIASNEFGVINAWDMTDTSHIWVGSANTVASATNAKIYMTTTGVSGTWNSATIPGSGGDQGLYYQAIAMTDNNNGVAGSNGGDIVKTTNGGVSWQPVNIPAGLSSFAVINMAALKDNMNTIFMSVNTGTDAYQLFKTTDYGTTWIEVTLPSQGQTSGLQHMVFVNPNLGYSGGNAGVILKYQGVTPVELTSFTAVPSMGKVTLNWKTATETNNRGFEIERKLEDASWVTIAFKAGNGTTTEAKEYSYTDDISSLNASVVSYRLKQVDFDGKNVYSQALTVENLVPAQFTLSQNYPNPFNPATLIQYQMPVDGFVSLKIYNSLGEEVASLVNEYKQAGTYKVNFNASSLSSGIYYYILRNSDNQVITKKMTLLK